MVLDGTIPPCSHPPSGLRPSGVTEIPLQPQDQLEWRRCEVHCDKVVYPSACVERACPFLYAVEEFGHTYIGCMQRVYGVEIDLEMLHEAEARHEGFGGMRTTRAPLPMCRVEVEEVLHAPIARGSSAASIPSSTSFRSEGRPSRSSLS